MREFLPHEDAEVEQLKSDYRSETPLIVVGYRAGLKAGLRRAIAAAQEQQSFAAAAAIQDILDA